MIFSYFGADQRTDERENSYIVRTINRNNMRYGILLIAILFSLSSCAPTHKVRVQYRSLDAEAFEKYIARENVLLVDVRTAEEFAAGHIVGVDENVDVRSATFFTDYQRLPKDRPIALYCRGGGRSKQVAGVMAGNGYNVVELSGGYNSWVEAGKATEK